MFYGATSSRSAPPWQFSLITLLWVVSGVAVAPSLLVSAPGAIAAPALMALSIVLPAVLTIVVIFGTRYQRTFCIGALFPVGALGFATLWVVTLSLFDPPGGPRLHELVDWIDFFDEIEGAYRGYSAAAWLLGLVVGYAAIWIRWYLERVRDEQE